MISQANWETSNNAHDAIAFRVDCVGVQLQGVVLFAAPQQKTHRRLAYELEVLEAKGGTQGGGNSPNAAGWTALLKCSGLAAEQSLARSSEADQHQVSAFEWFCHRSSSNFTWFS